MKNLFNKILFLFFLGFQFTFIFSQIENPNNPNKAFALPNYYYEILNFASKDSGLTRVDIFVQIPFAELQFYKYDNKFRAEYNLTISVFDEDNEKLLTEKTIYQKIETENYEQTSSIQNYDLNIRSFNLKPDNYTIVLILEDKDSRKTMKIENLFKVKDFSNDISISDILLTASQSGAFISGKIIPNVSKNIPNQKEGIPFYFEIYSAIIQKIKINYSIIDKHKNILFSRKYDKQLEIGRNTFSYKIDSVNLILGDYELKINLLTEDEKDILTTSKMFISHLPSIPYSIKDLDEAIEQMLYISSSSEIDSIRIIKDQKEKFDKFLNYWKRKDPSPVTIENEIFNEYYRRIEYANKNFTNYMKGWRTDMGMIYVLLGPPNNVERHPFDTSNKPYEVWEYYELNKKFIFVDNTGFGDYRLITPITGDIYRYR